MMRREVIHRRTAMVLAGSLGAAALLPVYWAAGGSWGLMEAMGAPELFHPPAGVMLLTGFCLAGWATVVLGAGGVWGLALPRRFFTVGSWVIAVTLLAVSADYFRSPAQWERLIAAPLMLVMWIAAVMVAWKPRRRKVFS
jgi:hypothetical protein